jgi:hypothetical protein
MPGCNMKIFSGDPTYKEVAENVKIGDPLTLVITIDEQDTYGIRITDCLVRDGLGLGRAEADQRRGVPARRRDHGEVRVLGGQDEGVGALPGAQVSLHGVGLLPVQREVVPQGRRRMRHFGKLATPNSLKNLTIPKG